MSIQDDHFDLEEYLDQQVKNANAGTPEHKAAKAARKAYDRVWEAFVDTENEVEKLRPVVGAVTTIVRHVVETQYGDPR